MKSYPILWVCMAIFVILLSGCSAPVQKKNASDGSSNSSSGSQYKPIVITSPTTHSVSGPVTYITYENPTYKIKLKYPSYLEKQEDSSGGIVFFLSPQNSTIEAFTANLNIFVINMSSQPMSLDEFTNRSIIEMRDIIADYNITDSRKATLAKGDAYLLSYTGSQGLFKLKWMSVYMIKNDTLYLITYTAGADKFASYLPTVNKMLDSFEITE
jgi:hypothetical protein